MRTSQLIFAIAILCIVLRAQDATNAFTPKNFAAKGDIIIPKDGQITSGTAAFS
jgi:hypothetical protein